MMPETVREIAAGHTVAVSRLLRMGFTSRTVRFWDGFGYLNAGGYDWQGHGGIISMSGMVQGDGLGASPATFTLDGTTPELLEAAKQSEVEVKNRPIAVFLQFLSERRVVLDSPVALWAGRMDRLSASIGVKTQSLSLTAETLFVDRIRAPWGLQTDTDQQARWPGDPGYSFMPSLRYKSVLWLRS